jgi:peptide/nickel transport system substrate-binding protein
MGERPPEPTDAGSAVIRTFLIADVRGYTLFTQQRGDEAAAKLAARFAEIAREVVDEHGGSVIELRGDEALAVFASARQAILAATHAQARFLEETRADVDLPLPVGIGLDAGEAVPVEGGYRGGALNLAARLCGQAGPGEILASQGVVHLARKVDGVATQDRGELHLKNLPEPVHVYRLVSEDGDPAEGFRAFAPRPAKPPTAPIRLAKAHPALAIVIALALIAAVAVPAGLALRSSGAPQIVEGNAVARIDEQAGHATGSVPLPSRPGDIAVDGSSIWVTLPDRGVVEQIDAPTMTLRDTVQVGAAPTGIAIGGGSVWVTNGGSGTVSRINQDTNNVVQTIHVPGGPAGIAIGFGSVWVANSYAATVSRIDLSKGTVTASIAVGDHPVDVATDDRSVWVANAASGSVSLLDPERNAEVQQFPVGSEVEAVSVGNGGVWVADGAGGIVSKLDPTTGTVTQTVDVGPAPADLSVTENITWVTQGAQGSLTRIEGSSGVPAATPIGAQAISIAAGAGAMWATVGASLATHRGGTLTVWGFKDLLDSLDPAIAYSPQSWAILSLTNDGLLGFRRTSGTAGAALVPDLATSIPRPTQGGTTYTFTMRSGIRYSTGDEVRPDDIQHAIERSLGHPLFLGGPSPAGQYLSDIVGADRCHPGVPCDLSQGIETNDGSGTITFHLRSPNPDFLYGLALPFGYAVPSATDDVLPSDGTVPATGPYVPTFNADGRAVTLDRNPSFAAWSTDRPDGLADRIVWELAADPAAPTRQVLAGRGDVSFGPPDVSDFRAVATDHAGQFYEVPRAGTFYVSFDTNVPPFNDPDVRRALNLAIDRNKMQKLFGPYTTVTCQLLPPNFPGYEPYCPYTRDPGPTWSAPNLKLAQTLVDRSGTKDVPVSVWTAPGWFPGPAAYLRDVLAALGYRATLKSVSDSAYSKAIFGHPRSVQIGMSGWSTDYPAESGFLGVLARCNSPSNESGFCDPAIDRRMAAATRLQFTQPSVAHERWAEIEHDVMDQAPWVPVVSRDWSNLVSKRVGNYQVNPQWGPLFDQMWVQ